MPSIDALIEALRGIGERTEEIEPEAGSRSFATHEAEIAELESRFHRELLGQTAVLEELSDEEEASARFQLAFCGQEIAALLVAAGRSSDAQRILGEAARLVDGGDYADELRAGVDEPEMLRALVHGRWLRRQRKERRAQKQFKRVEKEAQAEALRSAAQRARQGSRPIDKAPTLFTFNTFGFGVAGRRDRAEDGSYITTWGLTALFIPVIPLRAYRVYDHGDGSFAFLSREPLSAFARGWRNLVFAGVLALIGWGYIDSHLNDPERLARIAFESLGSGESAGAAEAGAHEQWWREHSRAAEASQRNESSARLAALYLAEVKQPVTAANAGQAVTALQRINALPFGGGAAGGSEIVAKQLVTWADGITGDTPAHRQARVRLLKAASRYLRADRAAVMRRLRTEQMTEAGEYAEDWPLLAAELYLEIHPGADSLRAAGEQLQKMGDRPSLWALMAPTVERWVSKSAKESSLASLREEVEASFAAAKKVVAAPLREEVLGSEEVAEARRYLAKHPTDQRVAMRVAGQQLSEGDTAGAEKTLAALGGPGLLEADALHMLAQLHLAKGEREAAEALLDPLLAVRLPRFREVAQQYQAASDKLRAALIRRAEEGDLPYGVMRELEGADEATSQEIYGRWFASQMESNPGLSGHRAAYERVATLVPICLTQGAIKLGRAGGKSGAEKRALLDEAERLYMSVAAEAQGLPSFHLNLGQVKYRLGQDAKGEAEFLQLLDRGEPQLTLAVAGAYRALGKVGRAEEIATALWDGNPPAEPEMKAQAAGLMAVMATQLNEKETWYERAAEHDPQSAFGLKEVRAERLLNEGKVNEADALLAEVARHYAEQAKHNGVSANNAALATRRRFACTGDRARIAEARAQLEAARRMMPDNALIVGNLAGFVEYQLELDVISQWVDVSLLRPGSGDALLLGATIRQGVDRQAFDAAVAGHRDFRNLLALTRQNVVLSPQRPGAYRIEARLAEIGPKLVPAEPLLAQIRDAKVDTADASAELEKWESGARDASTLENLDGGLRLYAQRLTDVDARGDVRTRAALRVLMAAALSGRARIRSSVEDLQAAAARLDEAKALWPELNVDRTLSGLHLSFAWLEAAQKSEPVRQLWSGELRRYGTEATLLRNAEKLRAPIAAIFSSEHGRTALALRRGSAKRDPRITDLALAQVAGDSELESLVRDSGALAKRHTELKISAALSPQESASPELLSWYEKASAGR